MKFFPGIFRIISVVLVLSLLAMAAPASAQTREMTIDPLEGSIGTTITIVGEGFNASTTSTDRYGIIYFSSQEASTLHDIDSDVTAYKIVDSLVYLDLEGEFTTTVEVPEVLDDGDDTEDVTVGTYYLYFCYYNLTTPPTVATRIRSVAEFDVTGGEISLGLSEGPVATEVEITGADFASSSSLTVYYDDEEIAIESGDEKTDSNGGFVSSVLIPASTTGDHTIKVTVSGSEAEATFTVEPEIILNPTSGNVTETVAITGTGFARRSDVVIYFNNAGVDTVTTDAAGSFEGSFAVPELDAGIYDVEAEDDEGNLETAKFTVAVPPSPSPAPQPTPTPEPEPETAINVETPAGAVGGTLAFSGAGFEPGEVTVTYDGEEVHTATVNEDGVFVAVFAVPVSKAGEHTVIATDGTSTEEFVFTVESEAPPTPSPLLPEMGVEVAWPLAFDWQSVTDESKPVTYSLQVATSDDFPTASLVLDKEGLAASTYIVTEAEQTDLAGRDDPYYWRVRAVDAASNASDWTGAREFYVPRPFSLPSWAIYSLLGLGGLALFAIGYWLGRRTAYYY